MQITCYVLYPYQFGTSDRDQAFKCSVPNSFYWKVRKVLSVEGPYLRIYDNWVDTDSQQHHQHCFGSGKKFKSSNNTIDIVVCVGPIVIYYSLWNEILSAVRSCLGRSLNLGRHCDSVKGSFGPAEVESTATEVTSLLCHVIVLDARQPLRDWVCGNNQLWCATHEHILNLKSLVGPDWNTPVSKLCLKWGCWEFMLACHVFVSKIPELLWA